MFIIHKAEVVKGWSFVCTICGERVAHGEKVILNNMMPGLVIQVKCIKELAKFVEEHKL